MKKMITPSDLQTKVTTMSVAGKYDWQTQTYSYDACKWGTTRTTSSQTCSGQHNFIDDYPMDSISD